MSKWREKEWRIPRKGEVVKDTEGTLGIVTRTEGTLVKRNLWVSNVSGTEMYTDSPAELFNLADLHTSKQFHIDRLKLKGFHEGCICQFKDKDDIPLELIHIEWNSLYVTPCLWLKDLRSFEESIFKTEDENTLSPFDSSFPPLETILSNIDSGLKYRIDLKLIEVQKPGWSSCGSIWEFKEQESAINEIECWKSRLKIRRVASVINANWSIKFPCWSIDISQDLNFRVKKIESFNGSCAYFPSALHAAIALKNVPKSDWEKSFYTSQDSLF